MHHAGTAAGHPGGQLSSTLYRRRTDKELAGTGVFARELTALGKKVLPSQADTVARPPTGPRVVLVSLRDPILDARTSPLPLINEQHWGVRIESWGSTTKALCEVNSIHGRCILVDGAVGGALG